jgi:hypothetical protein
MMTMTTTVFLIQVLENTLFLKQNHWLSTELFINIQIHTHMQLMSNLKCDNVLLKYPKKN